MTRYGVQPADVKLFSGGINSDDWVRIESETVSQQVLEDIIDGANSLPLQATEDPIIADDLDTTTITSPGLNAFKVNIFKNGVPDQMEIDIPDGSIVFKAVDVGQYLFEVYTEGSYATGFLFIEAIEAAP
jgi:hypothetical protein